MYNCLIIEDDFASALDIRVKLEKLGFGIKDIILDLNANTKIDTQGVDVILSDVKLGNNDFAFDLLSSKGKLPPVIFFSSYADIELYNRSKKVNPYIYLLKPVDLISLKSAIEGALSKKRKSAREEIKVDNNKVYIKSRGKLIPVELENLLYIQTEGNYCYIVTKKKKVVIRASLSTVMDIINYNRVIQAHRSYLINLDYIQNVDVSNDLVELEGFNIPIGRKYKKAILEILHQN